MKLLTTKEGSRVHLGRIDRPYTFVSPPESGEFALLLVVGDRSVSPEEQGELSRQFVREGCRYAVCFGHGCSSWDDSIDMVGVMDDVEGRAGAFVMTTWHEDETIEEVVEFFATNTRFDDWSAREYVVLVIGGPDALEARVRAAVVGRFGQEQQ